VVSFFGILVRPKVALVIIVVVALGIAGGVWAASSASPRPRPYRVTQIQNVFQGLSFSANQEPNKSATYTFDVENYNSFGIYVRHVGSPVPGLTLSKTVEWSTQQYDGPGAGLSETLTYKLGSCDRIPHGQINTKLQVRTYNGTWQTIKLALDGDGNQQWQVMLFSNDCPATSN
jgi:hypothetical protein